MRGPFSVHDAVKRELAVSGKEAVPSETVRIRLV